MNDHLAEWEIALGHHVLAHCLEGCNVHAHVDDDVDWDWRGWTIEEVDGDSDGTIEVHATQQTTQSEKVRRARYNPPGKAHPAEYKNHDVTLHAVARAKWSANSPLGGDEMFVEIDQEGGIPSPPDPEPHGL